MPSSLARAPVLFVYLCPLFLTSLLPYFFFFNFFLSLFIQPLFFVPEIDQATEVYFEDAAKD